jgi:hypothetical protein
MKKIWYFGDSNTEGYNLNHPWAIDYINWKGYTPKHWTEVLSERMGLPSHNLGKGGCDNYTIFDTLINNLDRISDEDIVIIGWTIPIRGRIANLDTNEWFTIVPMGNPNLKCITNDAILQLVSLRDSKLYTDEVLGWQKLIKKALSNNKIIFWSYFPEFADKGLVDYKYWLGKSPIISIRSETNGVIKDGHFGENGNLVIADVMYEYINQNTNQLKKII